MRYALTYTRLKKRAETATNNFVLKRARDLSSKPFQRVLLKLAKLWNRCNLENSGFRSTNEDR